MAIKKKNHKNIKTILEKKKIKIRKEKSKQ